jgi:dihydroxyacetone kinase
VTRLFDYPARFSDDMLAGFADANAGHMTCIPGGVVRARPTAPGKVEVVGNVFTSPSAGEAASVARTAIPACC